MFPFVPAPGTFLGNRPTPQVPDAPLASDDETAVRVLYPDSSDSTHIGSITGHVLPANPLALSGEPQGTTGIFAAQVVAVNAATGAVAAAAISGWSCSNPGPPVFDGSYTIAQLAVGASQAYQVYAEPLDGPVSPADVFEDSTICRNALSDPGWPPQFASRWGGPRPRFGGIQPCLVGGCGRMVCLGAAGRCRRQLTSLLVDGHPLSPLDRTGDVGDRVRIRW
jgi:hypothetical protein